MAKRRDNPDGRTFRPRLAGAAIGDALRAAHIDRAVHEERVITEWRELAGDRIAQRARPLGIKERVLVIEVATSAWLHELSLMRPQLLPALIARMGEPRVFDDLRFVLVGRMKRPTNRADTAGAGLVRRVRPAPPLLIPATGLAREEILRDTEAIADPELRELVARVRIGANR